MRTLTLCCLTFATPAALAAPAQQLQHRVKAGESLSEIAVKYDTTIEALREVNHLPSDLIRSGELLAVPWPEELRDPAETVRVIVHEVVPTESLGSLAERYHTTPLAIRMVNKLPGDVIKIGQKLQVPVTGTVPHRERKTYEIEGGDTLRAISEAHGIGTHVLRWLNPTVDWRNLREGQKIVVFVDTLEEAPAKKAKAPTPKAEAPAAKPAKAPLPAMKVPEKAPAKLVPDEDDAPALKIRPGPAAGKAVVPDDNDQDDAPEVDDDEE